MNGWRRLPWRRLGGSLLIALIVAGCGSTGGTSPSVSVNLGAGGPNGGQFSLSLQLLMGLTILSILPSVLLMATSFTRIVVVLSLLRSAIGIPQLPPNQIIIGLSLFLSLFVMGPTLASINQDALNPLTAGKITQQQAIDVVTTDLRTFLLKNTKPDTLASFVALSNSPRPAKAAEIPTEVLLPAFMVSELKTAFMMGFLLFIPFLIIDLVVASALMSMGMVMVAPTQIALPFKLLLFVLVDGWALIGESLVKSFVR